MKCLIVAAGQGTRLRERSGLKPLTPVGGVPLLERVIANAARAGVEGFVVVSGYRGEELRFWLDGLAERERLPIEHVVNEEWRGANGVSVQKAQAALDGPFLLAMCDHLVDPTILSDLMALETLDGVTLAVDRAVDHPLNDPLDATRVLCSEGRIERIGKMMAEYNAFDTGVFLCGPVLFEALAESRSRGDDSISGAMTVLAERGRAFVFDIGNRLWLDVDDLADLEKAERLVAEGRL